MDRKNLFTIGEVSKLFHISVSSLRHYEHIGLLTPEYIPQILAIVTMAPNNLKYTTQSGICGHWICLWPRLRTFSKIRISAVLRKSCYSKSMQPEKATRITTYRTKD